MTGMVIIVLFLGVLAGAVPASSVPDPRADAAAVVQFGNLRLTVLTATLVRMEVSGNSTFDDRATLTVVNRNLPVPQYTFQQLNRSAIQVETEALSIVYVDDPVDKCSSVYTLTDVIGPVRSPAYPDGTSAATQDQCCAICNADSGCSAWVYDPPGKFCYPLASFSSLQSNTPNRNVGTSTVKVSITFNAVGPHGEVVGQVTWTPASSNTGNNLNGTYSSLDCYSTPMQCNSEYEGKMGPGLLTTSGWFLWDDTHTARLVPAPTRPAGLPTWWSLDFVDSIDWYFQAHQPGPQHFRLAMAEWASVLGSIPILPRQAFGVWWSRYYTYTQTSFVQEVLSGYANNSIPLSTVVLDMDWHAEPTQPGCKSWGNYDVNTTLWPDMTGFAQAAHEYGVVTGHPLHISFNIHPDTGVDYCDSRYPIIARAMGVDPASKKTIDCDFGNETFANALFSVYLDADPLHAVDFWWTDYGGCGLAGNNPLLWSNRVMYEHREYGRHLRGQAFSRYGGLGNHRYPHGFSGDSFQHEVVLYWQIKTTQTAANVLFAYWSHDIGGFHDGQGCPGDHDPKNATGAELLLRWLQFGAVSPLLRTHCDHCERRIWLFPYFDQMRDAMILRNALVPYIYTTAFNTYNTGIAAVHPLYYDFAADDQVYSPLVVEREYMFGDAILASPISTITGGGAGASISWTTYLPGNGAAESWADWYGLHVYASGQKVTASYALGDVPLFVRTGSIVPMQTSAQYSDVNFPDPLVWAVWLGAVSGATTLFEDEGNSDAYKGGEYVLTNATYAGDFASASAFTFTIAPASVPGALPSGFPATRGHILHLRGFGSSSKSIASATVNGQAIPAGRSARGYYITSASEHSLAQPAGTLVVGTGPGFNSFASVTVTLEFS